MYKANILKSFVLFLLLMLTSLTMITNASATAVIFGEAAGAGINVSAGCQTCHASAGPTSKNDLKAGILNAYTQSGIAGVKTLLNPPAPVSCTLPQVRDAATNTCITPACPTGQIRNAAGVCAVAPVTCTLPQVRDAATNTCITPVVAPVTCTLPQVRDAATNTCVTPAVAPVTCTLPQVRDAATNTCITPVVAPVNCTAPEVIDAATNTCIAPTVPPVSCVLPNVLINGVCALTPVSCDETAKEYDHEAHEREEHAARDAHEAHEREEHAQHEAHEHEEHEEHEEHHGYGYRSKAKAAGLVIKAPSKQAIHAEQTLNLGVSAYGDERKIAMGVNLPKGARFVESYNGDLQLHQGVMGWKVPKSAAGKTIKIKVCAEAHSNDFNGAKQDTQFVAEDVVVQVLPKMKSILVAQPVVAGSSISSVAYNAALQRLEVFGQIKWSAKSSSAARKAAMVDSLQLSNANNAALLGTARVKANGQWSAAIPVTGTSVPGVIDATFKGRVVTALVKK